MSALAAVPSKPDREAQVNAALMTLWNVKGCIDLLIIHDIMGSLPEEIAALLRAMHGDVSATVAAIEETV